MRSETTGGTPPPSRLRIPTAPGRLQLACQEKYKPRISLYPGAAPPWPSARICGEHAGSETDSDFLRCQRVSLSSTMPRPQLRRTPCQGRLWLRLSKDSTRPEVVLSRSIPTLRAVLMCVRTHPISLSFLADHTTQHPSQDVSKIPVTSMGAIMNVASSGAQQIGTTFEPRFSQTHVSTRSRAYPYPVRARPPATNSRGL